MRLKSKGVGKKELVMDFREYTVVREGDELVVVGTIRDPINWDFTIRMCEDDLAGLVALGGNRSVFGLIWRWLFGRTPKHHWTQERDEHLAEGKKRLLVAKLDAQEKAADAMKPSPLAAAKRRLPAPSKVEKLDCPLNGNRCEVTFRPASAANGAPAKPREVVACSAMPNPSNIDCSKACLQAQTSAA